jgi:HEAT repeat protein
MATVDELIRQLETGSPHERVQAAHALGDHHDPRAIDALIQTLEDQHADCSARIAAAHALGRIGDAKAI